MQPLCDGVMPAIQTEPEQPLRGCVGSSLPGLPGAVGVSAQLLPLRSLWLLHLRRLRGRAGCRHEWPGGRFEHGRPAGSSSLLLLALLMAEDGLDRPLMAQAVGLAVLPLLLGLAPQDRGAGRQALRLDPVARQALDGLHRDLDLDDFLREPLPGTAVGRDVGVVPSHGGHHVLVVREPAPGRVQVDPANGTTGPDLGPGMGGDLAGFVDVAADIAGRQAKPPAGGDEEVGEILADPAAQRQRLAHRGPRRRHFLLVFEPAPHRSSRFSSPCCSEPSKPCGSVARNLSSSGPRLTSGLRRRYSSASRATGCVSRPGHAAQPLVQGSALGPHKAGGVDGHLLARGEQVEQVNPVAEAVAVGGHRGPRRRRSR